MKNLSPDMQAFQLELITLVGEVLRESLDQRIGDAESEPLDGEDRIRSYVCTDVENAIHEKLKEKYEKRAIEFQKAELKKLREQYRNDLD